MLNFFFSLSLKQELWQMSWGESGIYRNLHAELLLEANIKK